MHTATAVSSLTTPSRRVALQLERLLHARTFDSAAWDTLVATDLHVRIGNAQPMIGKDAALGELERFLNRVDSIGSGFCAMWRHREAIFAETEIAFTDACGVPRHIPCTFVARVTRDLVCDLRIHLDPSAIP
jgi:hypothetical protein